MLLTLLLNTTSFKSIPILTTAIILLIILMGENVDEEGRKGEGEGGVEQRQTRLNKQRYLPPPLLLDHGHSPHLTPHSQGPYRSNDLRSQPRQS